MPQIYKSFKALRAKLWLKSFSVLMFCWLSFFTLLAHSAESLIVRQLDVENGLSQSTVYDIFEDSYGFIWIGTESGVNRYDGQSFFKFEQQSNALININETYISAISEDASRRIWIGTNNGIAIYNPHNNHFDYIHPNSTAGTGLQSDNITDIVRHSDGTMWVSTYDGLYQYQAQSKTFKHYPIDEQDFAEGSNEITTLIEAPNGTLMLGTQNRGVLQYNPKIAKFSQIIFNEQPEQALFNRIFSLFFDSKQRLWIGSNAGLTLYEPNDEILHQPLNFLSQFKHFDVPRQRVRGIVEDEKGFLWVSIYGKGIISFHPRTLESRFYAYSPWLKHGLPGDALSKLVIDHNGLLWIGTEGYGVNIWNPISRAFKHLVHHKDDINSLSDNVVWSIVGDKKNNLWVGTEKGLNKVNLTNNKVTRFSNSNNLIYKIQIDPKNQGLWQATNKGVTFFDPINNISQKYLHRPNDTQSISSNMVYDLVIDSNYQLWLATSADLDRIDLTTGKIYHYNYEADNPNSLTKNTLISKLFIDTRGDLWIGTDNGLNRYNASKDNFDRFLYKEGESYNSETNFITSIAEIKRGVIWAGHSGKGISVLDFSNDSSVRKLSPKHSRITINNGLPTNIIFGIIPDHFGRAWISTMIGLVLYDISGHNHQIFSVKDGLVGNEFNDGAYYVANDGVMYFGTINGLAIVRPRDMKTLTTNSRLTFSHAILYQDHVEHRLSLLGKSSVQLSHRDYAIKLQFSDFDFYWSHNTRFAYRFGPHENWIDIGNSNSVTLNNLGIGSHQLEVRNKGRNGGWGASKSITIEVLPPWWRTIEAYIAYSILIVMITVLTMRRRADIRAEKQKMNAQLNLFAEAFKNTSEGVMIMHSTRVIVAVNSAFSAITGYSEIEAINSGTDILNSNKHGQDFYDHIWHTLDEENQWQGEIWQCNKQGVDIAVEMTISSVTVNEDKVSHYVAVFSDITERIKAEQELRKLAKFDALTGLPNRTLLQDRLEHAIHHGHREKQKLAIMFLDLDRFKQVNDSLGHDVGDLLLIAVAERISNVLREDDTFARLGGDEFVIILEDICEINKLVHVANLVIKELATPFNLGDYEVNTSTSIGIALYPDDGESSQALMKNADTAMYHAKAEGRNNFQFYTQSMNIQAFERLSVENELRQALEEEQFILYFQPRVQSESGKVHSLEALIRWNHPKKGLLAPGYFIDIAEESGLIVPMSEWVINKACHQLSSWTNAGFTEVSLSVNLSPRLFNHYDLVSFIEQTLQNYQLAPSRLELEITESMLMNDVETTIEDLHKLNDLGCHISVDDFGTGYSSLSYLHRFPVHTLKIDRSFVSAIEQHDKGKALVDIIINLAQNLGLEIVAEGVENRSQFEFLRAKAKQQIQGFYFSPAVNGEAAIPMLINGFNIEEVKEINPSFSINQF